MSWQQIYRRARYGRPVVVVSGLPRSGTSMLMKMLEAGGMPVWTDGIRAADDQNPKGYYELERIKDLDKTSDKRWVRDARGRAIKVISALLEHLPLTNNYHVLFMNRSVEEILQSQRTMLTRRGEVDTAASDDSLAAAYEAHLRYIKRWLAREPAFTALDVSHADVLGDPARTAARIRSFLRADLKLQPMVDVVDASLYRNRVTKP